MSFFHNKNRYRLGAILLLAVFLLASLLPLAFSMADGEDTLRTVRVGYMEHAGFIQRQEDGSYVGYTAEYLDEICKYTGWEVEYVLAPWREQLRMLEAGELDFVGVAQYTESRAERFLFSRQAIGLVQGVLSTLPEGENDIKTNPSACNGRTIGIIRGSRNVDVLRDYFKQEGYTYTLKQYDDQAALENALHNHEVDIIAAEQMGMGYNLRVIDRFTSDPFYYITSKDKADLMEELNLAVSKINAYEPTFNTKLYEKHFGLGATGDRPYFTPSECDYIETHKTVTVAMIAENKPMSYTDENGETVGVLPGILSRITELCGIEFVTTYVPEGMTPYEYIVTYPTHLVGTVIKNNPIYHDNRVLLTEPYYTTFSSLAVRKENMGAEDALANVHTIGMHASFETMRRYIQELHPNLTIVSYDTVEQGLQAVAERRVDGYTYTSSIIAPYLSNPRYSDLAVVDDRFVPNPLSALGLNTPDNEILIDILNKCIKMLPAEDVARIESEFIQKSLYQFEDVDALYRYRSVLFFAAIVMLGIISVLLYARLVEQKKHHNDMLRHAEYDMMTGIFNRDTLQQKAETLISETPGCRYAIILLNVDNMQKLNDTRGHAVGDEVLKALAAVLREQFRGSAVIGRTGGDEFGVVLFGLDSNAMLVSALARLQSAISRLHVHNGNVSISASIGVSVGVAGKTGLDTMMRQANEAFQSVKRNGKNGFAFYDTKTRISLGDTASPADTVAELEAQPQPEPVQDLPVDISLLEKDDSDYRLILDSFPNVAVYAIEQETFRVLYYNKRFEALCPRVRLGLSCKQLGYAPCKNCIVDAMEGQALAHTIFYSDDAGDEVEITAKQFLWKGKVPAVLVASWPRNLLTSSSDKLQSPTNHDSFDFITGGLTRLGFIRMVKRMQSGGVELTDYAILFVNIKDFKAVNELADSVGGDSLLRTVFTRIENSFLSPIIGARKDADHFAFLVEKSRLYLKQLPDLLSFHWNYAGKDLFIHCRCGIYEIDDPCLPVYKMIDRAKLAKDYIVDDYVRPYSIFEPSMLAEYSENAEAFLMFDSGIRNKEFTVFFQPVVDAKTERVVSCEALVRRITPDGAIVSPGRFIPILERTGYISKLDRFVFEEVARFMHKRMDSGLPVIPVSFNLSQKDFYDADFMEELATRIETSTLPRGFAMPELTESAYTMNELKHGAYLKRLRDAGARILLDDFGSGYSSFGMFKNYYFDRVKLDMSFVRQLSVNHNVRLVVDSIITMCHRLGVAIVAEGVETREELTILRDLDCDYIQGYYFSKPLNQEDFTAYLKEHL